MKNTSKALKKEHISLAMFSVYKICDPRQLSNYIANASVVDSCFMFISVFRAHQIKCGRFLSVVQCKRNNANLKHDSNVVVSFKTIQSFDGQSHLPNYIDLLDIQKPAIFLCTNKNPCNYD